MIPGPSDGELGGRQTRSVPGAAGIQRAVAEWSASWKLRWTAREVIGTARVRLPETAVAFVLCCVCLLAARPGLAPAPSAAGAALCRAAADARPVGAGLGLWTLATGRLRVARITVRRFRTRQAYSANTSASRQAGRYRYRPAVVLAGDIELNPGPVATPPVAPPALPTTYHVNARAPSLLLSLQNARSLKPKLGDLRTAAAELRGFHLIAITETWLDSTVLDSELEAGLPDHTWFRRDRGSFGGGVACAVRSQLQPTRLPDLPGSELLLVRLEAVSVTVAVCYRPPDDDQALMRLTEDD